MGCGSSAPVVLQPVATPVQVCGPQYVLSQPVYLKMKEKLFSWSGDDFKIKDVATDVTWFNVNGSAFSLRDKKVLLDANNQEICVGEEKFLAMNKTYQIYCGEKRVATVKKRILALRPTYDVWIVADQNLTRDSDTQVDGDKPDVVVGGGLLEVDWKFYLGHERDKHVFASCTKDWAQFQSVVFDVDNYLIECQPGFDIALLVMLKTVVDSVEDSEKD